MAAPAPRPQQKSATALRRGRSLDGGPSEGSPAVVEGPQKLQKLLHEDAIPYATAVWDSRTSWARCIHGSKIARFAALQLHGGKLLRAEAPGSERKARADESGEGNFSRPIHPRDPFPFRPCLSSFISARKALCHHEIFMKYRIPSLQLSAKRGLPSAGSSHWTRRGVSQNPCTSKNDLINDSLT